MRADGAAAIGDMVGSIHRIGALAQGRKPATAGPTGTSNAERLVLIEALRAEVRAGMGAGSVPFRSSHHFAARSFANFGIEGH